MRIMGLICLALLLLVLAVYYSRRPALNVEPHAAQEIEKAKRR